MTTPTDTRCCPPVTEAALDEEAAQRLAGVFAALGDPVRLRLFSLIASRPDGSCACDLVGPLGRSQPTVSHHLRALHEAGLVDRERQGRWIWYSVHPEALLEAATLINC
ncbi:MAG: Transcriptional repressor SmtB [Acidimicrobiaceae bacterium]|mgnify:CR=1 FL=1|jgi:ArsR family transcriptional regulator|nr:Transcriptional repressor SmtB [Acidimicrobiaceae bacterium]MDP6481597.1 metalloregulator ArsR/SmtB family transcription factor [Acidimicrobiales bacterium]MDP6696283.1 metalloregulator ArsR/SmtB family transcription factor [Acidimicrobiales bacterium]|tara:strand:+ start:199 stop:525 length:327 start_codon:yes stop_codon:yes gene_type:complete